MDFDLVLEEIGEFGQYQRINYFLICLPVLFASANSLSYVFTAGIPNYRCFIPNCDNPDRPRYNEPWVNNSAPGVTDINGVYVPQQCRRYIQRIGNYSISNDTCPHSMFYNEIESCKEWVFDENERTIVQDWNVTCFENQWKLAFVGTMHFAGLIVGTASSGVLADKYGRKIIFTVCIIFMSITGVLQGLAWDYGSFLIFAFLNAVGTSGVYPLAFILAVEMVGPKKREMSSVLLNYFYALGEAAVGLVAWLSRDWQILQFVLSAPPILFAFYYWIIPESVRWLLARDSKDEALEIIRKVAKINGKELSTAMISRFERKEMEEIDPEQKANKISIVPITPLEKDIQKSEMLRTCKEAMQSRIMVIRFIVLLYIWLANAFVYYGLSLNSTSLSGNKYLNFSLVCLIEIPGYSLAWITMNKIGRRWSLAGSLFLCAICCAAGGFLTDGADGLGTTWVVITMFLIGKLGITSSFTVIFVYSAEMLPTIIRSGGVGTLSTTGRFGAMIATFVPLLGTYFKPLPLLLFGGVALFGSAISLILPETFQTKLPDTVEEAEQIGKNI
ncbi:organic cation transporter protein isoform X1 [Hermetia illucens]|uniref:organic cation transporter protein isoform X1 n=1 Tax=Hermetia illucens TaxID=343691 RepID=UPI0018CC4ED5|nr:organic cation transporter protein isoform X1 [Hermetia illucens]